MELSISKDASSIVIDGVITGSKGMKRVRFLLDTGASECFVHRSILIGAGYPEGKGEFIADVTTAGGLVKSEFFEIDSLRIFNKEVANIRVSSFNIPDNVGIEGLLGMNFLRNFKLTLDFPNGKLRID